MSTLERVKPVYCGTCGMPVEYCEYSPDLETHCTPWLRKNHPDLLEKFYRGAGEGGGDGNDDGAPEKEKKIRPENPWTTEERLMAFYEKYEPTKVDNVPSLLEKYAGKEEKLFIALTKKYGPEPADPYYEDDSDEDDDSDGEEEGVGGGGEAAASSSSKKISKKNRRGVGAKKTAKVDTRIVIQKISRNRKKATTVVIGMDTVPDIKLKDVSKAFSKRFAGSSSVKQTATGAKEIIVQGDHMDAIAQMIVTQFKVPGESVYLDIDGEFVPFK